MGNKMKVPHYVVDASLMEERSLMLRNAIKPVSIISVREPGLINRGDTGPRYDWGM